jgi:O-antigen/teichoic acid export membrane protein
MSLNWRVREMMQLNRLLDRNFLENYLKDFSWVAAGMGLAMIVDFTFYIIAGRLMSPVEYGYFGVLTSLYYIFLRSPFRTLEVVSKKIQAEGENSLDILGRNSIILGSIMFVCFVILSYPLSHLLGIPAASVMVFSMVFPLGYFLSVLVGKIQGEQKYSLYGKYELLSSLLAFSAIFLVYLGFGARGAVMMFVIEILTGLIVIYRSESISLGKKKFSYYKLLQNSFVYIIAVHTAFSLDLIAVQYFFSSDITGFYNVVAVLGKGLFFGAVAVNRSVFPKLVSDKEDRIRNLQLSVILVVIGGVFAAVFFSLFGELFIQLTFGASYTQAVAYAPHYMFMISAISTVALMASYCLSTDTGYVKMAFIMPIIQLVLLILFHETVLQIIYSTLTAAIITGMLFTVVVLKSRN